MEDEDVQSWHKYPQYRIWLNKLYLAERMRYVCGPAGIPPPIEAEYVIRPIMNLAGMGVGARVVTMGPNDYITKLSAGYFWCEYFQGRHLSVDYIREGGMFKQINAYEGVNEKDFLHRFHSWTSVDDKIELPGMFLDMEIDRLNLEMIVTADGKHRVFEIHLRNGFDHMMEYKEILPVFKGEPMRKEGYRFIEGPADGYGELLYPRVGYLVK